MTKRTIYTPDLPAYVRSLVDKSENGLTDLEICQFIGARIKESGNKIASQTLANWRKLYPELDQAVLDVKRVVAANVETSLYKLCMGFELVDMQITENPDGTVKKVITKKQIPPNPASVFYYLGNRLPDRWHSVNRIEHSGIKDGEPIKIKNDIDISEEVKKIVSILPDVTI